MDRWKLDFIINVLFEFMCDPWTGDTRMSFERDILENPHDVLYCVASRIKEIKEEKGEETA